MWKFSASPLHQGLFETFIILVAAVALHTALRLFSARIRAGHLGSMLRRAGQVLIPLLVVLGILKVVLEFSNNSLLVKALQTGIGFAAIWLAIVLVRIFFFNEAAANTWRARVPGLFVDIVSATVLVVGAGLVVGLVWQRDLGGLVATLGISSIVLGLALQDTLGNLFAGIALFFERPFVPGDWIKVGDTKGQVVETNWRAVRLRTGCLDIVSVPNSVLIKERVHNYNMPSGLHGRDVRLGFSYDDSPERVKEFLLRLALETDGVLTEPKPFVLLSGYGESSINYTVRIFVEGFGSAGTVEDRFLTKVWSAARQQGLTMPFPSRTVYLKREPEGT